MEASATISEEIPREVCEGWLAWTVTPVEKDAQLVDGTAIDVLLRLVDKPVPCKRPREEEEEGAENDDEEETEDGVELATLILRRRFVCQR